MLKRFLSITLSLTAFAFMFSCDFSKRLNENQKAIEGLNAEVRLLKESVANYERAVKGQGREIASIKKRLDAKPKPKPATTSSSTRLRRK